MASEYKNLADEFKKLQNDNSNLKIDFHQVYKSYTQATNDNHHKYFIIQDLVRKKKVQKLTEELERIGQNVIFLIFCSLYFKHVVKKGGFQRCSIRPSEVLL